MRHRKKRILLSVGALTVAVVTVVPTAGQATPIRIKLVGDAPTLPPGAVKEAPVPASQTVTVRVQLKLHNQAAAEAAAQAVSTPGSAQYGEFLTPEQFHATYSPTDADVALVSEWLSAAGLTVGEVPANHAYVTATGSAAQISLTFATTMSTVRLANGQRHRAADSDPSVPTRLGDVVDSVSGLTVALKVPQHVGGSSDSPDGAAAPVATAPAAAQTATVPGTVPPADGFRNAQPCSSYWGEKVDKSAPSLGAGYPSPLPWSPCGYKPGQLRSAYGVDGAVNRGNDGSGVTVAIVDAYSSPTIVRDAKTYAQRNDPSHPFRGDKFSQQQFQPVTLEGPNDCDAAGWYGEETLDVEAVHAMAPGANIMFAGASSCLDSDIDVALNAVIDANQAQIVSNSYGDQGEVIDPAEVTAFEKIALQAALQGIGLYFSSGDSGDESGNLGAPSADFSASSPLVTAVGGTSIGIGRNGNTKFEEGWSTAKSTLDATTNTWGPIGFLYGGGGGPSKLFSEPFYQLFAVPKRLSQTSDHHRHRVVPDVAMDGDPTTGMLVGQTQTFPDGVYYDQYRVGGTSLSSPLFAGVMALADQKAGFRHGFANPLLYFVSGGNAFNDIIPGEQLAAERSDFGNGVDATDGLVTSARTIDSESQSLHATSGYDNLTGLGVPNGQSFLRALSFDR